MLRKKLPPIFLLIILLLSTLSVFVPSSGAVTISPGTYFVAGSKNYTVSHTMTFSSITIMGTYVIFNTTMIFPTVTTWIELAYIDHDPLTTTVPEKVLDFNYTSYSSNYFFINGFKPSEQYRVARNNVNWTYPIADSSGNIVFTTTLTGKINVKIYDYVAPGADTTPPTLVINFAGNHGDKGGPYWLPPGESTALSGVNLDGYYTNASYQNESWIYINTTATDNIGVTSVLLHWKNQTTGTWKNTTAFTQHGTYWDVNTSGLITMQKGHKYTFDVVASDAAGNSKLVWWNKTGLTGSYIRRYVYLKNTPVSIVYKPLYLIQANYSTLGANTFDRLHHDQSYGNLNDTGYLTGTVPSSFMNLRYCSNSVMFFYDNNTCITPFILDNVYYHLFYTSDDNILSVVGQGASRDNAVATDEYTSGSVNNKLAHTMYYNSVYTNTNNNYSLEANFFNCTNVAVSDNNIFEHFVTMHGNKPTVISNRSMLSFVLFNVPSNATLNASYADSDSDGLSDWTELYRTYTNPFLSDTDNDGENDYTEYYQGSDPNNYTSIGPTTPPSLPVVQTNSASGVEETNSTLNGLLVDDGGVLTSCGFQYGKTTSYGTTKDLLSTIYYNQTAYDDYILMATGGYATRTSFRNTSFTGKITAVSWYLRKSGYPTGNLYCRIRYASNDTLIEQSSTILDSTTVTAAVTWYKFIFTNDIYLTNEDIYVNIEYVPTHSGLHFIWVSIKAAPDVDGYYYISPTYTLYGTATLKMEYLTSYSISAILYNALGLIQGELYHFRAYATNSYGTSYGYDKTFLTKPNAPTGLNIVYTGSNNIQTLSWTHGTGYNRTVLRAKVDGPYPTGPTTDTGIYNGSGTSKTVNNTFLSPGKLYYYKGWSCASAGGLQQYSDNTMTCIGLTKPYPPTNPHITIALPTVNISWTKGTGANKTILVYKSTGYPTSYNDGTIIYNGTGTYYNYVTTNGSVYCYAAFSYTNYSSYHAISDNGTKFTNVTGGGFIINCYDETNHTGLTFNVLISNQNGSKNYQKTGCTNSQGINASLCPQGHNINIFVSSANHQSRTYVIDIFNGIIYTLNAYLPHNTSGGGESAAALYNIQVIESYFTGYIYSEVPVPDVHVTIQRYINTTNEYQDISSLITDANGYVNLYLIPGTNLYITCEKTGYDTSSGYWTPSSPDIYGHIDVKKFLIKKIAIPVSNKVDFATTIVFTASMNTSGVLCIRYFDITGNTTNTQIYVYESFNGSIVSVGNDSKILNNDYYFNISGLNDTRMYIVVLCFNSTNDFNLEDYRITITVPPLEIFNHNIHFDLEKRITDNFGQVKIGPQVFTWIGFFMSLLPLIVLTLFDPANVGIGILTTGFFMAGIQAFLLMWTVNTLNPITLTLTPVVIVIGVLYILAQRNGYL